MNNIVAHERDIALTGMADFLREEYKIPDDKAILVYSRTGGYDVSWSIGEDKKETLLLERAKAQGHRAALSEQARKKARKRRIRRRERERLRPPKKSILG